MSEKPLNKPYAIFISIMSILMGTMNTILTKYQNYQSFTCDDETYECQKCEEESEDCIDFEQPIFQTLYTFAGETFCFFAFYLIVFYLKCISRSNDPNKEEAIKTDLVGFKRLLFILPAVFDVIGTMLLNFGLLYTYASVYQMLRGCVVVFTGIFSVIFLKRKQHAHHWIGIGLVVTGVAIVGSSPVIFDVGDITPAKKPILGDVLIIFGMVFAALQYIVEEKLLSKYNTPVLLAVGLEGVFGVVILIVFLTVLGLTLGASKEIGSIFDIKFAGQLFIQYPSIMVPSILCVFTYASSNFFAVSITKVLSATSRSTVEAMRTLSVWIFGLIVGWETFIWLQIIGFVVLVLGTFTYNEIIRLPFIKYPSKDPETKPLLSKANPEGTESTDSTTIN